MREATRAVHAGLPEPVQGGPLHPSPIFAATFHAFGDPTGYTHTYARSNSATPAWEPLERAISELEGGPAVVFASGMAAVSAVLMSCLRPDGVVVVPADGYYTARRLATTFLAEFGVETRVVPTSGQAWRSAVDGADLIWLETPSNPGLEVCDVREIAAAAHARGALVAVDNTTATVLGQRPLALGADLSVASDTKAFAGHSDLLLGHVACATADLAERIRGHRTLHGAIPSPMDTWLAHRSLATLELRLRQQTANALAISASLAASPHVISVRYPGRPQDPSHAIASRQMRYFGPIVTFTLRDAVTAERFLDASRLIANATSFGGVQTTAERRARWGGDTVAEGLIRLSAGIEDPEDLVEDIEQALAAAHRPPGRAESRNRLNRRRSTPPSG